MSLFFYSTDGYIIDDSIQASEQELRLEDFFWTGSGDGPPHYVRRPILANESQHGRDTILKTSTVVATVYVDQNKVNESLKYIIILKYWFYNVFMFN